MAKKSWDIALGPFKQVPMNLFIMYMAGNSISIFPIMMVGMMFLRPVKALLAIKSTFVSLEGEHDHVALQKFFYLLGNLSLVALALYKCHSMGLLPTATSDWLAFMAHKTVSLFLSNHFIVGYRKPCTREKTFSYPECVKSTAICYLAELLHHY